MRALGTIALRGQQRRDRQLPSEDLAFVVHTVALLCIHPKVPHVNSVVSGGHIGTCAAWWVLHESDRSDFCGLNGMTSH